MTFRNGVIIAYKHDPRFRSSRQKMTHYFCLLKYQQFLWKLIYTLLFTHRHRNVLIWCKNKTSLWQKESQVTTLTFFYTWGNKISEKKK